MGEHRLASAGLDERRGRVTALASYADGAARVDAAGRSRGRRAPGLQDVALLAGVSHQTVSRVINDLPNVRPETRDKVLAAIAALGFRPNGAARALAGRRSATIGVVASGPDLLGPHGVLLAIEAAAREAGYFVSLASVDAAEAIPARLAHFGKQFVDGVIVIAPEIASADPVRSLDVGVPIVLVGGRGGGPDGEARPLVGSVTVDQRVGTMLAVRHLVGLGHRRIAHVAGPQGCFDARVRATAWQRELERLGLPVSRFEGDWTPQSGYEAGTRIRELIRLGDAEAPTAVFAANDLMALGLMHALAEGDLSVPYDVSVVGFDDVPGADHFGPGLTTVRQDFQALGQRCIATLLAAIEGAPHASTTIRPELVLRDSTTMPPAL
jgi:DNA-binding LacI/PurR family transcriptional regulator